MKKLLLQISFIAILLPAINGFSQINVYKPFTEVYGKWIGTETKWSAPSCSPGSWTKYKKYEAMGDTMVGAYNYKKVYVASSSGAPVWNGTDWVIPFGPALFEFGYRNDIPGKKVYYLDCTGGTNKDTLLFDFNLTVGGNLPNTFSYSHMGFTTNNPRRVVSSIDSIQICGTYYK